MLRSDKYSVSLPHLFNLHGRPSNLVPPALARSTQIMAGPLSVEDILAKQKADREAAAKVRPLCFPLLSALTLFQPKFLSKSERAALALEKRNAEVKLEQEKGDIETKERIDFERAAEEERRRAESARYGASNGNGNDGRCERSNGFRSNTDHFLDDRYGRPDSRNDRYNQQMPDNRNGAPQQNGNGHSNGYGNGYPTASRRHGPPIGPRRQQNGHAIAPSPLASSSTMTGSPKPTPPGDVALPTDNELSTIRARYLGQKADNKKPRLRKAADKKVIFDWNVSDDTSAMEQGTWTSEVKGKGPGGTMFGGRLAGFDERGKNTGQQGDSVDK